MVGNAAIGRTVTLTIMRNRVAKTVPIVIQASGEDKLGHASEAESGQPLGLKVADLDARMAQELGLVESSGVVVAAVAPGSTAAAAGVKPRDIILEVDRQAVKDRVSYERALGAENGEDVVLLLIKRSGGTLFIPVHRQG
jgi:serine protease Do